MTKFYQVQGKDNLDDWVTMIVTANNATQAKRKFIKGNLIDYFAGYDNSDWQIEDLHAKHLVKLDNFDSNDSFHIVKTLIFDYDWSFSDINDNVLTLNRNNYSDQILEHYLKTGEVETKENVEEG